MPQIPGGFELILILAVVLLLFGGKKIPQLAKGLGEGIRNFKKSVKDVQSEIDIDEHAKNKTTQKKPEDKSDTGKKE